LVICCWVNFAVLSSHCVDVVVCDVLEQLEVLQIITIHPCNLGVAKQSSFMWAKIDIVESSSSFMGSNVVRIQLNIWRVI
jgi:hypothetical protein